MTEKMSAQLYSEPQRMETLEKCPLCDGLIWIAPLQPDPPCGLMQCSACGIVFVSPRPRADAVKPRYDEYYDNKFGTSNPRQERRSQRHVRRLNRYAGKPGRLLEIGCGEGYFLKAARESGWHVDGIESSPPRIQRAKEWFGLELQCTDIHSAAFQPGTFDAIAMFQWIERTHDPRALLRRVNELLKPGGVIVMSTPNVLAHALKGRDANRWHIPRHLFFFSPKTLTRAVEREGFEVLRKTLKFYAALEEKLNWEPWPDCGPFKGVTRELWTPFGLYLAARKK